MTLVPGSKLALAMLGIALAMALVPRAGGQALDQFKNAVVEINVGKGADRAEENGTGFVVSVDGGTLSILTARHLFYDGRERFTDDISITLYADKLHPRKAVWLADSPALDLAVLEVSGVPLSVAQQMPSIAVRPESERLTIGETLYVFGGKSQAWQVPSVSISDTEDADRPNAVRFTGIGIRAGFSGSALVDSSGRLVAVHLGSIESDASFGHAQLMGSAYGILTHFGATMNRLQFLGAVSGVGAPLGPGHVANGTGLDEAGRATSPLSKAIATKQFDLARSLLANGADPNSGSPLTAAVEVGDADMVRRLFDRGAKIELANHPKDDGGIPMGIGVGLLYFAIVHNNLEVVKALVEHGANPKGPVLRYGNLLTIAAWVSSAEMVEFLLHERVEVDRDGSLANGTALHGAVSRGDLRMTKDLVAAGSDLQAISRPGLYETPLGLAYIHLADKGAERRAVFDFLLGCERTTPQDRMHVLALALNDCNAQIARQVAAMEIAPNTRKGEQPLLGAIRCGDLASLERLVKMGVDVNAQDRTGLTPLMLLLRTHGLPVATKCRIFSLLVERGARVLDPKSQEEVKALNAACSSQ